MWFHNLNRLSELNDEGVTTAAQALLRLPSKPVLRALSIVWGIILLMVFTGIYAVRLAAYLPIPF